MKIAAIYARVSTAHQEQEKTIDSQVDEIQLRIIADGNTLGTDLLFKDDGWSGNVIERPSLDNLRDAMKLKKFDVLYCYDLGRISRNFLNLLILKEEIKKAGIELISLHDIAATNPEEGLMQNVMGLFHEYDRIKIIEKFRRGKQYKIKSGHLMGYTPPFGYRLIRRSSTNKSTFEIEPHEAEVVRLMFHLVGKERYTIKKLAEYLKEKNILPQKSKTGTWARGRLSNLLSNTTYYGQAKYFKSEAIEPKNPVNLAKYKKIKKTSRRIRPDEEQMIVRVPAIVEKELFDKAQSVIKSNAVFAKRNQRRYDYNLSSLVRCTCGRARTGEGDYTRGHYYYRCTDRLYERSIRKCHEHAVRAEVLDELVWGKLSQVLTSPALIKEQIELWTNKQEKYSPISEFNIKSLQDKLKKVKEEEKRYLKAYGEGILDESLFKDQMQTVRAEIRSIEATIQETLQHTASTHKNVNIPDLEALCDKMKIWLSKASSEDKRVIFRLTLKSVTANQNEAVISGYIPLEIPEVTKNIEYESIHRYCGSPQCRQINFIQLFIKKTGGICCKLSFCNH